MYNKTKYKQRDKKLHDRKHGHVVDGKSIKKIQLDLYWKKVRERKEANDTKRSIRRNYQR
jgi:hypothetical protein